uniref:Uncharacterized protein n=1 Tax=Rhipicephalus zambeziensis TaxID=60191 RepID=A0A224YJH3_9ACAR
MCHNSFLRCTKITVYAHLKLSSKFLWKLTQYTSYRNHNEGTTESRHLLYGTEFQKSKQESFRARSNRNNFSRNKDCSCSRCGTCFAVTLCCNNGCT